MNCPGCSKDKIRIKKQSTVQEIKGDSIDVLVDKYHCSSCGLEFFDNELADKMVFAAAEKYKEKHNLLTATQIRNFREKLGMSQEQFAQYIRVGVASLKRWEDSGIQDASNDFLIRLRCDLSEIEKSEFELEEKIQGNMFNGLRQFSKKRYQALFIEFVKICKSPLFTYKALFYCDFLHFHRHGIGISGATYRHLPHGPVPYHGDQHVNGLLSDGYLKRSEGHDLTVVKTINDVFGEDEVQTIESVKRFIKKVGYRKLVNISHLEDAWDKTKDKETISYQYSKKLKVRFD